MPFGSVTLVPGVNVERTPTLLRTGVSESSLIRYRDGLIQKLGGWQLFYPFVVSGVPRALLAWQDLHGSQRLAVGTTTQLDVITSGVLQNVTPQVLTSNFAPNFSTTSGSAVVAIVDPNVSNVTVNDAVFFKTPVSIGGIVLDGLYQITQVTGTHAYEITASTLATTTCVNPTATNAGTAVANATLHFATTPAWAAAGMVVANLTHPTSIPANTLVQSVTGITAVMTLAAAAPGVSSGDSIVFASIPAFTTTTGAFIVTVTFFAHGLAVGDKINFVLSTTGNGVTINNDYAVATVPSANTFTIAASTQATASGTFVMNSGQAQLLYEIALGPPALGVGYGLGNYGEGGYGTGVLTSDQTGTDLTATDWSLVNWGEILLSNPKDGAIFYWAPTSGFQNSSIISTAPPFNAGIFVNMAQQILVAYGSSIRLSLGYQQQPLLVQWCDVGNFFDWTPTTANQAGNYTLSIGSKIMGGTASANQNLIWTDQDLWAMNYIGPDDVFGFNRIGVGAGLVSSKAAQQLRGSIYWMGRTNFYSYTAQGVTVLPCTVWDAVFQNLNTSFLENIRAMPNTPFNEVGWLYPSEASVNGECDSYVKMNITEPGQPWDNGPLPRSIWIDQNIFGMPIAATPTGVIYQQETTPDAAGQPLNASFTTGYFYLGEGEEFAIIDQVIPDFKWTSYTGTASAQIQLTFNIANFPGDTPRTYGPYSVTSATQYISVRFRGRLMSVTVQSNDVGSFWRIGLIKYRFASAGRR